MKAPLEGTTDFPISLSSTAEGISTITFVLSIELFKRRTSFNKGRVYSVSVTYYISSNLVRLGSGLSVLFMLVLLSFSYCLIVSYVFKVYGFPV